MKILLALFGLGLLLATTGCEVRTGYGGGYPAYYGEYPYTYYGSGVYVSPYHHYYYGPYRRGHWEHHGHWHHDWD